MAGPHQWMREADDDLASGRSLLDSGPPKHACFFAQQAAEKALKAVALKIHGSIPKTHDVVDLLQRVRAGDPSFPDHVQAATILTRYYGLLRYPDTRPRSWTPPTSTEAQESLRMADRIVSEVRARIAPPAAPPPAPGSPDTP